MSNCATGGLATYVPSEAMPWDAARLQHLFRRTAFGGKIDELISAARLSPEAAVNQLLDVAAGQSEWSDPEWAGLDYDDLIASGVEEPFELYVETVYRFLEDAREFGVREKLMLFWHDHFAVQYESHSCPGYNHTYFKLLQRFAFGNFRDFVKEMTLTPAMLVFLNGLENRVGSPNENYARELFELFTLGEDNGYTQEDITEASRALTGHNGYTTYCGEIIDTHWTFDAGDKTIFGKTGNYNSSTLIDLLFEERGAAIARFISEKLYRYYVNPSVDENVVAGMAQTFLANDFEIMPVLRQLLTSEHFFDASHFGVKIKNPVELTLGFLREGHFMEFKDRLAWSFWAMATMGQQVGQPPDVAGWPGNRSWIDSNRLTLRWQMLAGFSWVIFDADRSGYAAWAKVLTDESDDPEVIARAIVDYYIPRGLLDEDDYLTAVDVFKWDVPENYYTNREWNLDFQHASFQVVVLLQHISRLPEFQLT